MPPHVLVPLLGAPLDLGHSIVAVLIGLAGGFFIAELRLKPFPRVLRRKAPPPPVSGDGPWG